MKITFENNQNPNLDKVNTNERVTTKTNFKNTVNNILDISGMVMDNAYGDQGKTVKDVMEEASNIDVTNQKNMATVMSNTMSAKDYAKMQEEGLNPNDMEIEEVVTIVDRIKAELAKAGVSITGYTDDIDMAVLKEITGSEVMANAIMDQFHAKDLPVTESNAQETAAAYKKAMELSGLTEGELKYLVMNQLQPTIDELYLAKFSGSASADKQGQGYFSDANGYYSKKPENIDFKQLQPQIERVISESGLPLEEGVMKSAQWLIEKGVPLTSENLVSLEELKQVTLPIQAEDLVSAIANAISQGKKAGEANLSAGAVTESVPMPGAEVTTGVSGNSATVGNAATNNAANTTTSTTNYPVFTERDLHNITETRIMEETRLKMTIEANWKLMASGYSIDTTELEQLVDHLKTLEAQYARNLTGFANPARDLDIFKQTIQVASEMPALPAAVVGEYANHGSTWSLGTLFTEGKKMQRSMEAVVKNYETLMTMPNDEYGDNIQTAFRNVDAIIDEMNLEHNKLNQRAIRILGYNNMEITKESVANVMEADLTVTNVIEKMTPSKVLAMIREGINPLETSMEDLSNFLDSQEGTPEKMEKYTKFLQRLESNGNISDDEKESFIGIYRLLRQIEKSDGGVVGSLVSTGAELNFKNLLMAVRNQRRSFDFTVGDDFGGLDQMKLKGQTIDKQINSAYLSKFSKKLADRALELEAQMADQRRAYEIKDAEAAAAKAEAQMFDSAKGKEDAYNKQQLQDFREACQVEDDVYKFLTEMDMPVTANYVLAAKQMLAKRGSQYNFKKNVMKPEELLGLSDELIENFDDKENAVKEFQKFTDTIKERIDNKFMDSGSSVDVKGLQVMFKQLSIATRMSTEENYEIPVNIKGEVTSIRVKVLHQNEMKGTVTVTTELKKYGKVSAKITLNDRGVTGYAIADSDAGKEFLEGIKDDFGARLSEKNYNLKGYMVVTNPSLNFEAIERGKGQHEVQTKDLYQVAKTLIMTLKS